MRLPASFCGITGLKPTYGRVSRYGLIPLASSMDSVGILASNVHTVASVLDIISGFDVKDSTSVRMRHNLCSTHVQLSDVKDLLKHVRVGVPKVSQQSENSTIHSVLLSFTRTCRYTVVFFYLNGVYMTI